MQETNRKANKVIASNDVLEFWFGLEPKQHFVKDPKLDQEISIKFLETYWQVLAGETAHWRETSKGRLAEVIVLDQFARNIFRGDPQTFAGDSLCLALAQEAIRQGALKELEKQERMFLCMPFMHSESALIHETAMVLFTELGGNSLDYEIKHKVIIDRFGRYPHRNAVLGRTSTTEEIEFLKDNPGF